MTISTMISSASMGGCSASPGRDSEEQALRAEVCHRNRKGNQTAEGIHPGEPARQAGAFTLETLSHIENSEHDQGRPDHHQKDGSRGIRASAWLGKGRGKERTEDDHRSDPDHHPDKAGVRPDSDSVIARSQMVTVMGTGSNANATAIGVVRRVPATSRLIVPLILSRPR